MRKILLILVLMSVLALGCKQTPPLVGGDRDEHGCIGSAGYTWCEEKAKCIREWEEACSASDFCDNPNVAAVYAYDGFTRVVSIDEGAGSLFYKEDGTEVHCPVVAPDAMSEESIRLVFNDNWKELCVNAVP